MAWQHTGGLLATQCKDRQLRILDPRTKEIAGQCESHQGIKDSKVVWTSGPERRVFTTGFSGVRLTFDQLASPFQTVFIAGSPSRDHHSRFEKLVNAAKEHDSRHVGRHSGASL